MKVSQFKKLIREEVRKVLKEANTSLDPNATYKVDITTSRGDFDPGKVKKVVGEPSRVAKAVEKMALDDMKAAGYDDEDDISEFIQVIKLDQDTYYILTGEEGVTIVGKPKSQKYGQFWTLIDTDLDAAADMFDTMDADTAKSPDRAQSFQVGDIVHPLVDKRLQFKIVKLYSKESEFKAAMSKSPKGKEALKWYNNYIADFTSPGDKQHFTSFAELQLVSTKPANFRNSNYYHDSIWSEPVPIVLPTYELRK